MADNNMNLNSTPEQELDLEQLEQVSGGMFRGGNRIEEGAKLQPAAGGIMPVAGGDQAMIGKLKPNPIGGGSTPFSPVNAAGINSDGTPEDPAAEPKTSKAWVF